MVMMKGSWLEVMTFAGMAIAELADVVISTVSKAAMSKGMSPFVYVAYYNALGTLFLLLPFIFYRPKHHPLTFKILAEFFLLGLIGIGLAQVIWFNGIRYSSPTLSSAMTNLIPAFIFVLAIIFRKFRKVGGCQAPLAPPHVAPPLSVPGLQYKFLTRIPPSLKSISSFIPSLSFTDGH